MSVPDPKPPPGIPARILLVEDEPNVRKMLERFLAPSYVCLSASNGKEALDVLKAERDVDLVVTDVRMPQMDGIQLLKALRRTRPHLPVIAMTAYGSEDTAVEALRAGATNYLRKPFKTQEFLSIVKKCMELSQLRRGRIAALAHLRELTKIFEIPARLESARALLPHLTEGLVDLGIIESQDLLNLDVALEEALANAIIHGSLDLTEEAQALRSDREAFERAYWSRLADPKYSSRTVSVCVRVTRDEVSFTVEDKGPGFDPSALPPQEKLTTLQGVQGRGLMLIRLFMDEVVHENGGRRIRMTKRAPRIGP